MSSVKTDAQIQQEVLRELAWDPRVEETDAERAVQNLVGVRGVTDRMTVRSPRPPEPERVRIAIEDALERRAERQAKRVRVEVTPEGAVRLSGQVRTWADKRATLAAARFTPGVRAVEDHLQIDPWK